MIDFNDLTEEEERLLDEEFDRIFKLQPAHEIQCDNSNRAKSDYMADSERERFNSGTLHTGVKT